MKSLGTQFAFNTADVIAKGIASRDNPLKVFDWEEAAWKIKEAISNGITGPIIAGLSGDLDYTGGVIYNNGIVDDSYLYLASTWATPVIIFDGSEIECWKFQEDLPESWDAKTVWPEMARNILGDGTDPLTE